MLRWLALVGVLLCCGTAKAADTPAGPPTTANFTARFVESGAFKTAGARFAGLKCSPRPDKGVGCEGLVETKQFGISVLVWPGSDGKTITSAMLLMAPPGFAQRSAAMSMTTMFLIVAARLAAALAPETEDRIKHVSAVLEAIDQQPNAISAGGWTYSAGASMLVTFKMERMNP